VTDLLPHLTDLWLYLLVIGLVRAVNRAPTWGREVLSFLRDLRSYRSGE
jgi:hypothetical protein